MFGTVQVGYRCCLGQCKWDIVGGWDSASGISLVVGTVQVGYRWWLGQCKWDIVCWDRASGINVVVGSSAHAANVVLGHASGNHHVVGTVQGDS
ncbi:hypothetical protein HNY73_012484 [Argiope bruennichi]|uniref:Uncharacterized protein n=1 Tax=Argiope bruennichi TaxID=94029 RepID=A0A8T0EVM0_ARGBR|nr:hypothetical protein HNY73_012484 [Argiope bruennichi]